MPKQLIVRVRRGLRIAEGGGIYNGGDTLRIDADRYPSIADLVEKVEDVKQQNTAPFPALRDTALSSPTQATTLMPTPVLARMSEPREAPQRKAEPTTPTTPTTLPRRPPTKKTVAKCPSRTSAKKTATTKRKSR
jgi:outer membrane biosynthesis protein TonB